ncbi:YegP family protein [Pedobacter aquatilis]|uniref:YegP family protein n=1 Tax=Pedobacter aquatilis TaxID=351343 RepID=UPI0029317DB2|nr:DUF1508 domain-containing protein [Pedobacter aquatilis]
MKKFIITKRKNNEYQFNLESSNGRIILTSERFTAKAYGKKAIEPVNALNASVEDETI